MKMHLLEWSGSTVSFDFDDTLCLSTDGGNAPNLKVLSLLMKHHDTGDECIIITARDPDHESDEWISENEPHRIKVSDFVMAHRLPVVRVVFTNHSPKGPACLSNNVSLHYDDRDEEIESCAKFGVKAIRIGKTCRE